jgi:hypothetical protein
LNYLQSSPNGTQSNTTVQFVATTPATNLNLGLIDPSKLATEANPDTVTTCFVEGQFNGANKLGTALIRVPYNATGHDWNGSTKLASYQGSEVAQIQAVGAAYGIAWQGWRDRLYIGAYHKRYSGYGPNGADAIYVYNRAGAQQGVISLSTVTGTANVAGADPHDFTASGGVVYDIGTGNASYDGVVCAQPVQPPHLRTGCEQRCACQYDFGELVGCA